MPESREGDRMEPVKPLPAYLVQRYHGWRATTYAQNRVWYRKLADDGQRPRATLISCCDSRVHLTSLFGADAGEVFIHRNIANLVPPYEPGGDHHGTSAAVEYAVTVLKVAHIIVAGHSGCGGIQGCLDMCEGRAPELEAKTSFIGRWMDILRPAYKSVADVTGVQERLRAFEQRGVVISLENLMGFPFLRAALDSDRLSLHGVWHDIGEGQIHVYDPAGLGFQRI